MLGVIEQERLPVRNNSCRSRSDVGRDYSLVRPGCRQIDDVRIFVCDTSAEQPTYPESPGPTKTNTVLETWIIVLASDHVQEVFDHDSCACAYISSGQRIAIERMFLQDCQKLWTTVEGNRSAFTGPTEMARPRKRRDAIF
jgi:hypothetical protein